VRASHTPEGDVPPALLTPAAFSAATGGKVSPTDPRVQPLLDGATAGIRRYCGWHVAPKVTETLRFDGPGGNLLLLPSLRVVAVSSVTVRGVELDEDAFEWSEKGMLRRLGGCWPTRFRSVEVTLEHGFETAPDLVQIVQQVVANAISSPMGATREQAGQISISWATTAPGVSGGMSLLDRDLAILDMYRLPKEA